MPDAYIGREQAYLKHTILRTYLQRLFLIVGQGKETVINYVDCFAGPWKEENNKLSDTSIGISLEKIALCQRSLKENFGRNVKFRALYIENDSAAFGKLKNFLLRNPYPEIEAVCLEGDYTEMLKDIVYWCGNYFTFFFVDPMGWKKVVGAKTMLPLLRLDNAEFLINLMYDFINRAVSHEIHLDDMIELFGEAPTFNDETPEQRQKILLSLYRNNMKAHYKGYTAHVPVEKPGTDRVLYYLVHLTRHARGIDVFKSEAEKMEIVQRITQIECRLRRQFGRSETVDMFGGNSGVQIKQENYSNNKFEAKQYLLNHLSKIPTLLDFEKWAEFLEESDLYPSDFQMAMKDLVAEGAARNLDNDISRRKSKLIKPNWPNKSERWALV